MSIDEESKSWQLNDLHARFFSKGKILSGLKTVASELLLQKTKKEPFKMLDFPSNISPAAESSKNLIPQERSKSESSLNVEAFTFLQNARVLISHDETSLAITLLRQACNIQTHPLILRELTQALINTEKWDEAFRVARQWYQIDVCFLSTYYMAQIEYQLGRDEQSLKDYFEALALLEDSQPELFEIFKNVGNLFVRRGDFESAEEFYNKAYSLKSDSDILLVNYGILEMQRGDLNRARDRFRSAIHYNQMNDKAWVGLAMVHFDFGDEELGVANLKRALDIDPKNRTAIQLAVQKLNWTKHGVYLIEIVSQFLSSVDCDVEMSSQLIQLFVSRGEYFMASLEAQRLVLWNPESEQFQQIYQQIENRMNQEEVRQYA